MGTAFADWYCDQCDDETVIDGDSIYFGGPCGTCGAQMVTMPSEANREYSDDEPIEIQQQRDLEALGLTGARGDGEDCR